MAAVLVEAAAVGKDCRDGEQCGRRYRPCRHGNDAFPGHRHSPRGMNPNRLQVVTRVSFSIRREVKRSCASTSDGKQRESDSPSVLARSLFSNRIDSPESIQTTSAAPHWRVQRSALQPYSSDAVNRSHGTSVSPKSSRAPKEKALVRRGTGRGPSSPVESGDALRSGSSHRTDRYGRIRSTRAAAGCCRRRTNGTARSRGCSPGPGSRGFRAGRTGRYSPAAGR